jgi:acyl dehydratase
MQESPTMTPSARAAADPLATLEERLQPHHGRVVAQGVFAIERIKLDEFRRALPGGPSETVGVPLTFPEVARLQQDTDPYEVLGIDPRGMLHAEQEFDVLQPLDVGDELRVVTRLTSAERRTGRRAGEMLLVTLDSSFETATGEAKVRARRRLFVLTVTPTGNPAPPSEANWHGSRRIRALELRDVVRYAGASGDFNPIHYDRDLARARGNADVFAQGMLGAGVTAEVARGVAGPVRRLRCRFQDRIWLGRPLEVVWRRDRGTDEWTFVLRDEDSDKLQITAWTSTRS